MATPLPSSLSVPFSSDNISKLDGIGLYPYDTNTLTIQVRKTLCAAQDASTEGDLNGIRTFLDEQLAQEKWALQQSGEAKQQAILHIKLAIANELGAQRKFFKKKRLQEDNNLSITRILDAIESADDILEFYKPEANPVESATPGNIPLPLSPSMHQNNRTVQAFSTEKGANDNNPPPSPSSIALLGKLFLGLTACTTLYILLAFLIESLAFTLSVPFILGSTLFIALIILAHNIATPDTQTAEATHTLETLSRKVWYITSAPGKIASYMQSNPWDSMAYACVFTASTLFFLLTASGSQVIAQGAALVGISFYGVLYIAIPILTFLIVKAGRWFFVSHKTELDSPTTKEPFKPFSINPVARIWQAIDTFLSKFYLLGLQSPIAMFLFSVVYIGLTVQIMTPFLPAGLAAVVQYLLTGISNPTAGLLFAAVCTGWFVGLFILQVADVLTRRHESGTLKTIDSMREHPIDTVLFLSILILSAHIVAATPMAHICGRWLILGLITINFKPLLAIADFMLNPRKSTIGSSLVLPTMPVKLILYPGECLYYVSKLASHIVGGILKHFLLHVPLVIIRALFDMTTIVVSLFSTKAAESVIDANIDTYLLVRTAIIRVKHAGKTVQRTIRPYVKAANTVLSLVLGTYFCFLGTTGINYFLVGHTAFGLTLPGVQSTIMLATSFLSIPATMTIFAIIGSYFAILSAHQLCNPKVMRSNDNSSFNMMAQIIMAGLILTCALLIALQPPLYAAGVLGTVLGTILMTSVSTFCTHRIYSSIDQSTTPVGSNLNTHYSLIPWRKPQSQPRQEFNPSKHTA